MRALPLTLIAAAAISIAAAPATRAGHAVGTITAIDPAAATVTIKHGAIPAVGWPAMTMTFTAAPPTLLKGRKVGERVGFDLKVQGMAAQVTAIKPL